MPLPSLTNTDFTGSLLVNDSTQLFPQYITELYPKVVQQCLGETAYAQVVASDPLAQKWVDLFAGNIYTYAEDGKLAINAGLTLAVKSFIWAMFRRDNFTPTNVGMKKQLSENSERLSDETVARLVQNRYNEGVLIMRNIEVFIENYTDFEQPITGFVDNGGGSFTINTSATQYLADGDTVAIAGVEHTVSNVVADTSFDIVSTSANSFSGVYISNPYEDVCIGNLEAMI